LWHKPLAEIAEDRGQRTEVGGPVGGDSVFRLEGKGVDREDDDDEDDWNSDIVSA